MIEELLATGQLRQHEVENVMLLKEYTGRR
jgi:hypothetical protein